LIAAVYLDAGIAGVSEFAAQQVFPALIKLRENIELVQPESHLERLNTVLKSAHLLPYFRTKQVPFIFIYLLLAISSLEVINILFQVLNEGTTNTEYIVALSVGGIEMATGRGTNTAAARNNAAAVAMQNPSLVALLPAVAKTIVTEHLNKIGAPPSKVLSKALHIESQTAQPSALTGKPQL
jgi:dsRNA-specific ribonuclease